MQTVRPPRNPSCLVLILYWPCLSPLHLPVSSFLTPTSMSPAPAVVGSSGAAAAGASPTKRDKLKSQSASFAFPSVCSSLNSSIFLGLLLSSAPTRAGATLFPNSLQSRSRTSHKQHFCLSPLNLPRGTLHSLSLAIAAFPESFLSRSFPITLQRMW